MRKNKDEVQLGRSNNEAKHVVPVMTVLIQTKFRYLQIYKTGFIVITTIFFK